MKKKKRGNEILAEERTVLAKQRTMQSFMRTGITLMGFGFAIVVTSIKILNFALWGIGIGIFLIIFGFYMVAYYAWWTQRYTKKTEILEHDIQKKITNEKVTDSSGPNIKKGLKIPLRKIRKKRLS